MLTSPENAKRWKLPLLYGGLALLVGTVVLASSAVAASLCRKRKGEERGRPHNHVDEAPTPLQGSNRLEAAAGTNYDLEIVEGNQYYGGDTRGSSRPATNNTTSTFDNDFEVVTNNNYYR